MSPVVLVPCRQLRDITPQTEDCLQEFERRGIRVSRQPSCTLLEEARSIAVDKVFSCTGHDALLFWDADIVTDNVGAVIDLLFRDEHGGQVWAGLFRRQGGNGLAAEGVPDPIPRQPFPVAMIGGGCLLITKRAAQRVGARLPEFADPSGFGYREYFGRLRCQVPGDARYRRMSEIYSFCHRCHESGVEVFCEPRINLGHLRRDSDLVDWVREPIH